MNEVIYILAAISTINLVLGIVLIRNLQSFRKTQNELLIRVIIAGLATQEDKMNLLLHDRGYDKDKINDWIVIQQRLST